MFNQSLWYLRRQKYEVKKEESGSVIEKVYSVRFFTSKSLWLIVFGPQQQ